MTMKSVRVPVTNLWEAADAPHQRDAPMTDPSPDARAWVAAMDDEEKRSLRGRLGSQLLLGEPVDVLEERGPVSRVVCPWQPCGHDPRGYPGWVASEHLADPPEPRAYEAVVVCDSARLTGFSDGVSFGTILPVRDADETMVQVELPHGESGDLRRSDCVLRPTGPEHVLDPAEVVPTAERFSGLAYLWGGLSEYGLDCSGLVHLTFRALGRRIPRDASDQADSAETVAPADARPGDLYFYARPGARIHHVGLASGDRASNQVLHAPATGRGVVSETMSPDRRETLLDYVGRFTS